MEKNENHHNEWTKIVAKAWSDPKFKEELLKNPKEVCKKNGLDFGDKSVKILVCPENSVGLILPEKSTNIPEQDLLNVIGGLDCVIYVCA